MKIKNLNMEKDFLDQLIDANMVPEGKSRNYKFKFPIGKNFKVNIIFHSAYNGRDPKDYNIRSKSQGTYITLQHHGRRIPIGSRRWFRTYDEAEIAAKIWNSLLSTSNTRWGLTAEVTTREEQKAWEMKS